MSTIRVLYSCPVCGIVKRPVAVPARQETEDIVAWVNGKVLHLVMLDHTRTSLLCEAETVDLYLPAPKDARFIGEKDNPPQGEQPQRSSKWKQPTRIAAGTRRATRN